MTSSALLRSLSATACAAVVVVGLAACGTSVTTDDAVRSTTTHPTPSSPASSAANPSGTQYTIADYIRDADITQVAIRQGDSSGPSVVLPDLPGWVEATAQAPDGTYRAIKYTPGIKATDYSPNVVVLVSKLTGRTIDPDKLLAAAPGELRNLTGFTPIGSPELETLSGYKAYKIAGTYDLDGLDAVVGQSTVLIPGTNTAFVVQINVTGARSQLDIVKSAVRAIDKGVRISV